MNYRNYITIEPNKRGGKSCVRGLRITVYEVLKYLASSMTQEEISDKRGRMIAKHYADGTEPTSWKVWPMNEKERQEWHETVKEELRGFRERLKDSNLS